LELFKAEASTEIWRAYVDYLDDMVLDGFFNAIHASLNYILDNTDPKTNTLAIFEAKLELQAPDMVFIPSLDYVSGSFGFYDMVEAIVSDVYAMATLVARLADHNESTHYQVQFTRSNSTS
jgi:dynein heavy chain